MEEGLANGGRCASGEREMKTNYHMHTVWCDGRNTVEVMIRAAIDRGFDEIGFSSHARLPEIGRAHV